MVEPKPNTRTARELNNIGYKISNCFLNDIPLKEAPIKVLAQAKDVEKLTWIAKKGNEKAVDALAELGAIEQLLDIGMGSFTTTNMAVMCLRRIAQNEAIKHRGRGETPLTFKAALEALNLIEAYGESKEARKIASKSLLEDV